MMVKKPAGRWIRRDDRWGMLLVLGAVMAVGTSSCGRGEERPRATEVRKVGQELKWVGDFALGAGTLYRRGNGVPEAVAVLPGAGVGMDTVVECTVHTPELGEARFRLLQQAPDSGLAAWATMGPGTCVGTLSAGDPAVRVLGYWPAAATDRLLWAPAGSYLAVWLDHHGQRGSLCVFDAVNGVRLEMPWEAECEYVGDCDIEKAEWLGGSLLNVMIRLGPAERSVPFEVNVEAAATLGTEEEY
jgi:hypothetical protein